MTTSTASITVPSRHRQDGPDWAFHQLLAAVAYLARLALWAIAFHIVLLRRRLERSPRSIHAAVIITAYSLMITAAGAVAVLAA